jgi:hypothetical protein
MALCRLTHCWGDNWMNDLEYAERYQCLPIICSGWLISLQNEIIRFHVKQEYQKSLQLVYNVEMSDVLAARTVAEDGRCTHLLYHLLLPSTVTCSVLVQHIAGQALQHTDIFFAKAMSSCVRPLTLPPGSQAHLKPWPALVMRSSQTRSRTCTGIHVRCWQTTT